MRYPLAALGMPRRSDESRRAAPTGWSVLRQHLNQMSRRVAGLSAAKAGARSPSTRRSGWDVEPAPGDPQPRRYWRGEHRHEPRHDHAGAGARAQLQRGRAARFLRRQRAFRQHIIGYAVFGLLRRAIQEIRPIQFRMPLIANTHEVADLPSLTRATTPAVSLRLAECLLPQYGSEREPNLPRAQLRAPRLRSPREQFAQNVFAVDLQTDQTGVVMVALLQV